MDTLTVHSKRDIIDYINNHPTGSRRGTLIAFIALGGIFVDAYDFTSLGIGVNTLKHQLGLGALELSGVTASMAVGALIGALIGGPLVDRLGRFKIFTLDLILFVVAAIGAALAPNVGLLIFFRLLLGFGVGVDMPASLSFVAEVTNTRRKGRNINFWQGIWYVATVCSAAIVLPFYFADTNENLWRWAVGFGAAPAAIVLVLRLVYTDESPMWAAHRLGLRDAAAILKKHYKNLSIDIAPGAIDATGRKPVGFGVILRKPYRARTFLASVLSCFQSMEYYAVGFYVPVIVSLILGKGILFTVIGTVVINLFGILGGWLQPFFTFRVGVWKLALIGCVIAAAALIMAGATRSTVPAYIGGLLIGIFIFGHSFGQGSQGKTMAAMSYPTEYRGIGTGWAESMSRVGSIFGFLVFPLVLAAVGLANTLMLLTIIPLIMLASLLAVRWEPVGKDVETVVTPVPAQGDQRV